MAVSTLAAGCCKKENPLLTKWDTPYQTPPFDKIKLEHYEPAFDQAMAEQKAEIEAIASSNDKPTFANTIVAMEFAGKSLTRVAEVFYNLLSCETSDSLQAIAQRVQPKITELSNDISLNGELFARVKAVYDKRDSLGLEVDQMTLLDKSYKSFTRNGANLSEADKAVYRELTSELSGLTLEFGQNVLKATNAFSMTIPQEDSAKIAGMPTFAVEGMAQEAAESGEKGWKVTLQAPSYRPFMTYCADRGLKHTLWLKYGSRAYKDEFDNRSNIKRITELRMKIANLLGYKTYADYVLEERMAGSVGAVNGLLSELLTATKARATQDFNTVRSYALAQPGGEEFAAWDWGYYDEKYRMEYYDLNEEQIKPYLKLENVQKGVFMLAEKLYGITFKANKKIPVYNKEVSTYEVYDQDGKMLAILYLDFFPRASKRPGAWMTTYRDMYVDPVSGKEVRPLVSLCCNFTKPTASAPSLLTFDELTTLLHEFGHALHGIFAEGRYPSLTGTNVYRDFVELPSQIMENWAYEKEFLDLWAVHYQTGEKMPAQLIEKIVAAKNYLAAYMNVRQLTYGMDDMAWHSITAPVTMDVEEFEWKATSGTQFFPQNREVCFSASFNHIFSGGYAAGYYSYKWAEVLEADAFSLFKEKGIFNREVAESFRREVLSKGGSENPMTLYVRFRGHKPEVKPLLEKMGVE